MWTGYGNENDENAKIIIMLRENEKQKVTGLAWILKAVHATFPPEFYKQRPLLEQQGTEGNKSHCNGEIRQKAYFVLIKILTHTVYLYFHPLNKKERDHF